MHCKIARLSVKTEVLLIDHGRFVISDRICEFAFFSAIIFPRSYHHIVFLIWLSVKQVAILSHFFYDTKMRVSNFSDLEEFSKNLPLHYYQYLQQKKTYRQRMTQKLIYAMSNMLYARVQICNSGGTMEDRSAPLSTPSHPLMALQCPHHFYLLIILSIIVLT